MPITVTHQLSMTTPDDPAYENKPSNWNASHAFTANMAASEISGAFSNANGFSFVNGGGSIAGSYTVPSVAGLISNINVSAGTTSGNLSALTFSNSNGVSFGLNNGTITASVNAAGGGLTNINVSAGTTSNNLSAFTFANSNGVSFGLDASTFTASHNGLTTARASNDGVGLNTAQTNVTWTVNSSGISLNAGGYAGTGFTSTTTGGTAIVATQNTAGLSMNVPNFLTTAALSNHSHGNPQLNLTNLSGTTASNSAGFTLSLSAAAPGAAAESNAFNLLGANTAGNTTATGSTIGLSGINITLSGTNASQIVVSGPAQSNLTVAGNLSLSTAGSTMTISQLPFNVYAVSNTTQSTSGTIDARSLSFHGAGGVSVGVSNGSVVVSGATGGGAGGAAISAGTQSGNTGTIVFSNSNNISFGMSGSTRITASFSESNQTLGLYALGNTTQNSSTTLDARTMSFNALGAMTAGYSNGSIQLSAPPTSSLHAGANITISTAGSTISIIGGTAAPSPIIVSAGTSSASISSVVFSDSNGVSFGLNGSTITGSHNGLTSQSNQALSAANGSFAFQTASFSNANGVSFVTAAGSAIQASVETSYAASNHSHGNPTLALTNLSGTTASASNGFTLSLSAAAPGGGAQTGISGVGVSDTTYTSGTFIFSNQANVTIGSSVDGASQYVRFSVAPVTNSVWTVSDAASSATVGRLAFTNLNGVTLSLSTGAAGSHTIVGSHNALTSQSNQNVTAANGGFAFQTLSFSNLNGISFGTSAGSAITASHNGLTTARASNDAIGLNTAQTNVTWTVNSSGLSLNAAGYAGTATAITGGAAITLNSAGLSFNGASLAGTTSGFTGANISASITHNTAGLAMSMSVAAPGAAAEANAINLLGANTAGNTTVTGSTLGFSGVNLTLSGTNNSQMVISAPATSSLAFGNGLSISTNGSTISVLRATYSNWEPTLAGNNSTFSSLGQNSLYMQKMLPNENYAFSNVELRMSGSFVSSTNSQVVAHSISYGLYSLNGATYSSISTSQMVISASYNSNTAMGYTISQGGASFTTSSGGTGIASLMSGFKHLYLPFTSTLSAGVSYAFGINISSATTVGTSPMRMAILNQTILNNLTIGKIHATTILASNTSFVGDFNQAVGSVTTGAMPSSIANSAMTNAVSQARLYLQLD
jgi:hypothetical protein